MEELFSELIARGDLPSMFLGAVGMAILAMLRAKGFRIGSTLRSAIKAPVSDDGSLPLVLIRAAIQDYKKARDEADRRFQKAIQQAVDIHGQELPAERTLWAVLDQVNEERSA